MSELSTRARANVTLVCSVAPATPVTTTWLRRFTSAASTKFWLITPGRSTIGFASGFMPIERARSVTLCPRTRAPGTVIVKLPAAFEPTDRFISVMKMLAPSIGRPWSVVTLP